MGKIIPECSRQGVFFIFGGHHALYDITTAICAMMRPPHDADKDQEFGEWRFPEC